MNALRSFATRLLALVAVASLAIGPAADAQFRPGRLTGYNSGLRLFAAAAASTSTVFYTSTTQGAPIVVPTGITSARVTIWAPGAGGNSPGGGGGGALSQSVISVTPSETLYSYLQSPASFKNPGTLSSLQRQSGVVLVGAYGGDGQTASTIGGGGQASQGIGTNRYSGANGSESSGGGAAGTFGDGNFNNPGASATFTATSNGATATAGAGSAGAAAAGNYGGGGGPTTASAAGSGIIIIEWGKTQ